MGRWASEEAWLSAVCLLTLSVSQSVSQWVCWLLTCAGLGAGACLVDGEAHPSSWSSKGEVTATAGERAGLGAATCKGGGGRPVMMREQVSDEMTGAMRAGREGKSPRLTGPRRECMHRGEEEGSLCVSAVRTGGATAVVGEGAAANGSGSWCRPRPPTHSSSTTRTASADTTQNPHWSEACCRWSAWHHDERLPGTVSTVRQVMRHVVVVCAGLPLGVAAVAGEASGGGA